MSSMEKYTVDIDKVLDDFEETEALKISTSHKHTDASLLQPSLLNCDGDQINGNERNEADGIVENMEEDMVSSHDENLLCLDSDKPPENMDTETECLNELETSNNSAIIKSNFSMSTEEVPVNSTLKPDHSDSTFNEYLSVTGDHSDSTSYECPSVTVSDINEIKIDEHEDSSSVYSVSVSEKNSDSGTNSSKEPVIDSVSESHADENVLLKYDNPHENVLVEHSYAMHFSNASTCDKDFRESSEAAKGTNSNVSNLKSNEAVDFTGAEASINVTVLDGGLNSDFNEQICDTELKTSMKKDASNVADACCSISGAVASELSEESFKYDSHSISNSVAEENNESDEFKDRPLPMFPHNDDEEHQYELISDDEMDDVGACAPLHAEFEPIADDEEESIRNDSHSASNSVAEENNDESDESEEDHPLPMPPQNDNVEGISDDEVNDIDVAARARLQALRAEFEPITDEEEDSGVSSDENASSPLFFFNNQMFNFNRMNVRTNRVPVRVHRVGPANNLVVEAAKIPEVNDSANIPQPEAIKNEESDEIYAKKEYPSSSENVAGVQSPNKFTGARPKSESLNQTSIGTCDVLTAETKDFENMDLKLDNVAACSESTENQEEKNEVFSEKSPPDDCDNMNKSSDLLPVNISNTEFVDTCCSNEAETKCDPEIISANTDSLTADIETESPVLSSDAKIDSFPHRLPRPTTLDLPSRHVAIAPVSEENGAMLPESNNLVSLTGPEFLPNEMAVDDSVSDASQSVKQQPRIGLVKPFWIPDAEAPNCMHCGMKFTVIKRRHHCRACGKVLCSRCCNLRAKLAFSNKEDRICHPCFEILSSSSQNENVPGPLADSQSSSSCGSSPNFSPSPQIPNSNFSDKNTWRPHPNNPDDYCSTIPPLQQIQLSGTRPPPTVMVPIGVLKRGNKPRREPKQVIFSDGIRPGGDLTDLTEPADVVPVYRRVGRKRVEKAISGDSVNASGSPIPASPSQRTRQKRVLVSDEEGPLPPVVLQIVDNEKFKDEKLEWNQLLERMQDDDQKPVNFALLKNMHLFVKLIKLDCCYGKECWCFTSHGLCAVGQDEVMVILERLPDENSLPRGIVKLFTHIYDSASKGSTFEDLGHIIFPEQILGSSDHRGFLFVRPTFQCLSKLVVPNTPFLVAILIHKWEVPWAKVFPLRLMLRLGAECRYYPCALVSVRHRKPVFFEIGQTIMSVLSDLRNYQFTIPVIPGLVVHMEEKKTCVNIPRNRYERVMKILNSNNVEHVLALGSNFSSEADSHLVCMQKEEGDYQTQAINIENTTRRVTGASFIVFSGALKSSSGLSAKFSIVEDGLLVQIPQETMVALHMALRDMKDLTIECGQINAAEPEEVVIVQWTRDDKKFNIGVRSPIDCKSLEGVPNVRIHTSTDYAGENYLIRWTEVFFLEVDESSNSVQHELVDPCRLAETVAQSCCMALAPYLDQLAESELTKIGLRVTLDSERDRVEYDVGGRGKPLPAMYMNALDCGLIPVILRLSGSAQSEPVSFELIFHILIK